MDEVYKFIKILREKVKAHPYSLGEKLDSIILDSLDEMQVSNQVNPDQTD